MHKKTQFLKDTAVGDDIKNIIFLDIDGVLQPYKNADSFNHDMTATAEFLKNKYNNENFIKANIYDVCSAYYNWDETAVGIIKQIIQDCNASIVIHSGWKEGSTLEYMKALFQIYDMDEYIIGMCDSGEKTRVIKKYLREHAEEIDNYVVIDDNPYDKEFGLHFCRTNNIINYDNYKQVCYILKNKYEFVLDIQMISCYKNNNEIIEVNYCINTVDEISNLFFIKFKDELCAEDYNIIINEITKIITETYLNVMALIVIPPIGCNISGLLKNNIDFKNQENNKIWYYLDVKRKGFDSCKYFNKNKNEISHLIESLNNLSTERVSK